MQQRNIRKQAMRDPSCPRSTRGIFLSSHTFFYLRGALEEFPLRGGPRVK